MQAMHLHEAPADRGLHNKVKISLRLQKSDIFYSSYHPTVHKNKSTSFILKTIQYGYLLTSSRGRLVA